MGDVRDATEQELSEPHGEYQTGGAAPRRSVLGTESEFSAGGEKHIKSQAVRTPGKSHLPPA